MFMLAHLPVSALRCNLNFLRVHTAPHTRLSDGRCPPSRTSSLT